MTSGVAGSRRPRESRAGFLLLLPIALAVCFLFLYPFGTAVWLSFTDKDLLRPGYRMVGFQNYAELLRDPDRDQLGAADDPILLSTALGVGEDLVGLLLGLDERLLLPVLGVALRVLHNAERLFLGAADGFGGNPLAVGDPDGKHGRCGHQGDDDVYEVPIYRQHA